MKPKPISKRVSALARELGRRGRGKPKRLSDAERARRSAHMRAIRQPRKKVVPQ
jgi:hypothetical protein